MFFRHDPFGMRIAPLIMHRRRTSRDTASIPFTSNEDLPTLALRIRSRAAPRSKLAPIFSFRAWARALGFGGEESPARPTRGPRSGPRAA